MTLQRYEVLGFWDGLPEPTFRVDEWWAAGTTVDLGGRPLQLLATPGHTPTSVSLYDAQRHQLFVGDFVYPGHLYAFLPGASRSAYLETTKRLLSTIDPQTVIYAAHMAGPPAPIRAPTLAVADLRALQATLIALQQGRLEPIASGGLEQVAGFPRVYPVNAKMSFATGFWWNNR